MSKFKVGDELVHSYDDNILMRVVSVDEIVYELEERINIFKKHKYLIGTVDSMYTLVYRKQKEAINIEKLVSSTCDHTKKYANYAIRTGFWYCPDCKQDLGDV